MKVKGTVGATIGFSAPNDGWHNAVIQEGLNLHVNETSGKESFMVPFMIEGDDDEGKRVTLFINTRNEKKEPYKKVEENFGDLVVNLKLKDEIEKKFADAESFLETRVIEALKIKLPGMPIKIFIETDKNGKQNIRKLNTIDADVSSDTKPKAAAKPATKPAAQADGGNDW